MIQRFKQNQKEARVHFIPDLKDRVFVTLRTPEVINSFGYTPVASYTASHDRWLPAFCLIIHKKRGICFCKISILLENLYSNKCFLKSFTVVKSKSTVALLECIEFTFSIIRFDFIYTVYI